MQQTDLNRSEALAARLGLNLALSGAASTMLFFRKHHAGFQAFRDELHLGRAQLFAEAGDVLCSAKWFAIVASRVKDRAQKIQHAKKALDAACNWLEWARKERELPILNEALFSPIIEAGKIFLEARDRAEHSADQRLETIRTVLEFAEYFKGQTNESLGAAPAYHARLYQAYSLVANQSLLLMQELYEWRPDMDENMRAVRESLPPIADCARLAKRHLNAFAAPWSEVPDKKLASFGIAREDYQLLLSELLYVGGMGAFESAMNIDRSLYPPEEVPGKLLELFRLYGEAQTLLERASTELRPIAANDRQAASKREYMEKMLGRLETYADVDEAAWRERHTRATADAS